MGLDMYMNKKKGVHDHVNVARFMRARARFMDYALRAICHHEKVDYDDPTEEVINSVMSLAQEMEPILMEEAGLVGYSMDNSGDEDLAYWRKHADLNEYMTQLYYQKTPVKYQAGRFNCVNLMLTKDELLTLIQKITRELVNPGSEFKTGTGFFWGETQYEDWVETLNDLNTIVNTTDFENETVYYSCWY